MNNRLLTGLTAAAIATVMAVASPVFARGGHVGFGGGHFGGGGHFAGGMHVGGMGGARFAHAGGPAFGGVRFAHAAIGPRFAGAGWHGHHGFCICRLQPGGRLLAHQRALSLPSAFRRRRP